MAGKMPGRAAQTASSIPGAIYHAPPTRRQGCRPLKAECRMKNVECLFPVKIQLMWKPPPPCMRIPPPAT
jgi:hypothetical protein